MKKASFQTNQIDFLGTYVHILYHCRCNFKQIPFLLKFRTTLFGYLRFRTKC